MKLFGKKVSLLDQAWAKQEERKQQEAIAKKNAVIDEIHQAFYTEVDRILEDAKVMRAEDPGESELIDKGRRLKALGFTQTVHAKELKELEERNYKAREENKNKEKVKKAVEYFSQKYPMYRFITREGVLRICGKYGLVFGDVGDYIGTVPDENLKHMEQFKIDPDDVCYGKFANSMSSFLGGVLLIGVCENPDIEERKKKAAFDAATEGMDPMDKLIRQYQMNDGFGYISIHQQPWTSRLPLEIVAPQKEFNMTRRKVVDGQVVQDDPIVLQPVFYGGSKYYLIVTAWGQEASDPEVVNAKHN